MGEYQVRKERIEPLWDRVDRNRVRLALFVLLFLVCSAIGLDILLGLGLVGLFFLSDSPDWWTVVYRNLPELFMFTSIGGVFVAGAYAAWSLSRSEHWLLKRFDAVIIPKGEMLDTKFALKDMAIAAGYEVAPALYLMDTMNVNAFAFGHSRRRAVIGVTRGMVTRLEIDEQRAVFANLMSSLRAGDTMWATGVTSLMHPLWAARERQFRVDDERHLAALGAPDSIGERPTQMATATGGGGAAFAMFLLIAWLFVLISEIVLAGHRASHLRHSETSDAEGMLLLKDPHAMLSALEKSVRFNNFVPTAGPGFTLLFFSYTGDDTDDENDPEMRRVTRLREVLGVEGQAPVQREQNTRVMQAPAAPAFGSEHVAATLAEHDEDWSVSVAKAPSDPGWLSVLWVAGVVVLAAGITYVAMVFDASLPRHATDAYDSVPIGHVFGIALGLLGVVCVSAPFVAGMLDGRASVGMEAGVVAGLVWMGIVAVAIGQRSGGVGIILYSAGPAAVTAGWAGFAVRQLFDKRL